MKGVLTAAVFWMAWACGPAATAAVVITALPAPQLLYDDLLGSYVPYDVDGNGSADFTFNPNPSGVKFRTERSNRLIYVPDAPPDLGGGVASLQSPFLILSPLNVSGFGWRSSDLLGGYVSPGEIAFADIVQVFSSGTFSHFNGRGAIGIEFESELGTHFGYFDIEAYPGYSGAWIYGWAYETQPGVPIMAGQVPEPSLSVLLSIGLTTPIARRHRKPRQNKTLLATDGAAVFAERDGSL
jgi:hypothetical protein